MFFITHHHGSFAVSNISQAFSTDSLVDIRGHCPTDVRANFGLETTGVFDPYIEVDDYFILTIIYINIMKNYLFVCM